MNYKNYYLAVLSLLLFCQIDAQTNCDNFQSNSLSNYNFQIAVDGNTQGCNTQTINNLNNYDFLPQFGLDINVIDRPVTFVDANDNPTLGNLGLNRAPNDGTQGIRLNFRSTNILEENTTILTRNLGLITERYLNIDYSVVFQVPNHPENVNFISFKITNLISGNIVEEKCLDVNDVNGINDTDASDNLKDTRNGEWRYNDWSCLSFDLENFLNTTGNLELEIIVADCGEAAHDTLLYLDNICFEENPCDCEDGEISMNPISINCPEDSFTVSGNYTLPTCNAENPTNIELTLVPFNPNSGNSGSPQFVSQSNFSNNIYSFNVNPTTLNLDNTLEYDIVATANFSDGSSWSVSNVGKEITFINCEDPCTLNPDDCNDPPLDDCNDYWVAILDEYIDGTQSGSNSVFLMANGNYPYGTNYYWRVRRQNGQVQTYDTLNQIVQVEASINNRIVSATVTVTYEECTETVRRRFDCAIPNSDANGNLFPECSNTGGGFNRLNNDVKVYPNPINSGESIKITGLESYDLENVEIIDLSGNIKSVQKIKSNTIQLGNLKTGIYFIKISTKQGIIQKKIIVN